MKKRKIVFAVLAGKKKGMGHLARSSLLAESLMPLANISFVICSKDKLALDSLNLASRRFKARFIKESRELKKALAEENPDLVVLDMLSLKTAFLSPRKYRIVALDNYAKGSDVYINILKSGFESKPLRTKEFSGYKYWLLKKPKRRKKPIKKVKSVLISFGYTDPLGLSVKVLKSMVPFLKKSDEFKDVRLTCVITSMFRKGVENDIRRIARTTGSISIKKDVRDMGNEILKADLCITGGGNTMFEAISQGVPCFVVPIGSRNLGLTRELEKEIYVKVISKPESIDEAAIHNTFKRLTPSMIDRMQKACYRYDSQGLERVKKIILNELRATR